VLRILVVVHVDANHLPGILALRGHEVEVRCVGSTVLSRIISRPIIARVPIAILAMATLLLPLPLPLPLPVPAALASGTPVMGIVTRGLHAGRALLVVVRLPGQGIGSLRIGTPGVGCSTSSICTAHAALLGGTSVGSILALAIGTLVVHLGLAGRGMGHRQRRLLATRGRLMTVAGLLLARRGAAADVLLLRLAIGIKGVVGVRGELLPG